MRRKQELYNEDDTENYKRKLIKEKVHIRRNEREVTFNRKRKNFIPTQHLLKQNEKNQKGKEEQNEQNSSSTESKSENHQEPENLYIVIDELYSKQIQKANTSQFTIDSLNQLTDLVTSEKTSDIIFGAIGLRKLSIDNFDNVQQIIDTGLLDVFIQLLNYQKSPQVRLEVTWCIANIAAGTTEQCRLLVSKGVIPRLVDLLKKRELGIVEQAVWAIGNISSDCPQFRDQLLDAGAGEALTQIILNECYGDHFKSECCWSLTNLCRGNPLPQYQKIKNPLKIICSMLATGCINNYEVFIDSCWVLTYHYTIENQRFKTLVEFNILEQLIPIALSNEDQFIIFPILRMIGHLAVGDYVGYLLDLQVLDLLSITLRSSKKSMKRESAWILSNLAASHQPKHVEMILKNDKIILKIMEMFASDLEQVRREVGFIFRNVCYGGKQFNLDKVYTQIDITQCYLSLLQSENEEIVYDALDSLTVILNYGYQKMKQRGSKVNLIGEELLKNGGVKIIQKLQYHKSDKIYLKCSQMILDYFQVEDSEIEKLKFREKVEQIINSKEQSIGDEVS